jgi:copper chaperone CopZ
MYKFEIDKMGCMNCVRHIEEELKVLDKAVELKPDLKSRILEVESSVSRDDIKRVIEDAGYQVKDLK